MGENIIAGCALIMSINGGISVEFLIFSAFRPSNSEQWVINHSNIPRSTRLIDYHDTLQFLRVVRTIRIFNTTSLKPNFLTNFIKWIFQYAQRQFERRCIFISHVTVWKYFSTARVKVVRFSLVEFQFAGSLKRRQLPQTRESDFERRFCTMK